MKNKQINIKNRLKNLNEVVEEIISLRDETNSCLFMNSLLNALENQQITKEEMNQCILEMLIAGTDTSSVTMFYFLLALSDRNQLEENLLKENSYSILTNDLKESMRFKPVGPVIMRCA
jgi:aromatase